MCGRILRWLILSVFVLCIVVDIKAVDEEARSLEYRMVQEKKFEKEIKDVRFGETKDGKLYPKIIVFKDEVSFYDEDGNLITGCSCSDYWSIAFSTNNKYILIPVEETIPDKGIDGWRRLVAYTHRGKKLWEKRDEEIYDIPSLTYYLSDKDGSAVGVDYRVGILFFVDSTGKEIKKVDVFEDDEFDLEKWGYGGFSGDGRYFVVNIKKRPAVSIGGYPEDHPGVSGNPHLILFTPDGRELWRRELPGFYSREVAISSNGKYIVVTGHAFHKQKGAIDEYTWLMNNNGVVIEKYNFYTRNIAFSSDEEYVVLNYWKPRATIQLVKSKSGEIIWKHEPEEPCGHVSDLAISEDGKVTVTFANVGWDKNRRGIPAIPQVCILNNLGNLIYKRTLPERDLINAKLSKDDDQLIISTSKGIELTRREEK